MCISVGVDGKTVWGCNASHDIYRHISGHDWAQVPGKLMWVSINNPNRAVGANSNHDLYEWNGTTWIQLQGKGMCTSITHDSSELWVVNSQGNILKTH